MKASLNNDDDVGDRTHEQNESFEIYDNGLEDQKCVARADDIIDATWTTDLTAWNVIHFISEGERSSSGTPSERSYKIPEQMNIVSYM